MVKVISNRPNEVNVEWHLSDESTMDIEELSTVIQEVSAYVTALSDPHPAVAGYRFNETKLEVKGIKVPDPKGEYNTIDVKPNRRISIRLSNTRAIRHVTVDSTFINFFYKEDNLFNIYLDKKDNHAKGS